MLQYTQTEWIMLSEIFRGEEETCFQIMRDFPEDAIFSLDWELLYKERRISIAQLKRYQNLDETLIEGYEKDCWRKEITILTPNSKEYPARLLQYYHPPLVLYAVGDLSLLQNDNALTVVGTRAASDYGMKTAYRLSAEVAAKGITIVSGCAVGIDTAAHRGALSVSGRTIAVLGCGLDVNYPAENYGLRKKIVQNGGLQISEYLPGTKPFSTFFPHRNRILSGLSRAVLLAEAPYKSGSLITAEHAIEQGKELYCVPPYSIWDPKCSGVSAYLRDGATPVFSAADLLIHYFTMEADLFDTDSFPAKAAAYPKPSAEPVIKEQTEKTVQPEPPCEQVKEPVPEQEAPEFADARFGKVYEALRDTPLSTDALVMACAMPVHELFAVLCELELLGAAQNVKGGYIRKQK